MNTADQFMLALTAWRENRGGGTPGMTSVMNVIMNRVTHRHTSAYEECVRPLQFSSITAKGDGQLALYPDKNDSRWIEAQLLAERALNGELTDITDGAVLYYAPAAIKSDVTIDLPTGQTVPFPHDWDKSVVTYTTTIADQIFFR